MKIIVIAKPSAREEKVEKISPSAGSTCSLQANSGQVEYKVSVKEPAKEGRANWAIERALGEYFKISPLRVKIISGHTSRRKVIEIL